MQTQLSRIRLLAAVLLLLAPLPAEALRVTDVAITSRPTNGDTYRTNETIEVAVTFDNRVRGGGLGFTIGSTFLNVVIGTNTRTFNYESGDGTTQLVFSYTVQSSDRDTDGISVTSIFSNPALFITTAQDVRPIERLPDSEYALPRNQIANAGPHKVNRSAPTSTAPTSIFYHNYVGNTERLYRHSGIDYRPATALAFDGRNRPYMLSYAVYGNESADNRFTITTLRNGEWTSFSFKDEFIAALGAPSSTLPTTDRYSEMVIDQHDDLYAVLQWVSVRPAGSSSDVNKSALLYAKNVASSSFNGDFQVLEVPGKVMLETRMSANDFANYPPLVGWTAEHSDSDPTYPYPQRVSWAFAAWHKFYVLPLRRDANGDVAGMTLADSIRVDNKLGYVTSHSGGQSFAVTRGDMSFIAYMRHEGETNTYGNNTVYARAFYRKNHQEGVGDTLSARKQLFLSHPDFADAHSTPVVAIDLDGYIHVLGGAHGGPFAYRKSSHPMDITSWDDVANVGSGRTYSSLVIDNLSYMYSTFRVPRPYKLFFQDGNTTTGFARNSNGILFADQNCGHAYRIYYHSQHKDRPRPGNNERIYVNWTANCEANLDHWDGYRILAYTDDHGETFQLSTKADFNNRIERLDTSPESFTFTERTGAQPDAQVTSDTITVRGINSVVPIEVTGGTLLVNGRDFTGTTVARGQKVAVKVSASSEVNTETTATVTIGGVSANFAVTTVVGTADAGDNQTVYEGDAVTLSGSSTYPERATLTYSWRQTAGSPNVTLTNANTQTASFAAPEVAEKTTLTFELTVSDGSSSATDTITITVHPSPVTAEAGDNQTVYEGDAVTLKGSGTDPQEKPLTYSWRQTSGTDVSLSSTSVAAPTFTAPNLPTTEDLTFELTVSNGSFSDIDTVTITVNADNDAPTADAGTNQTVAQETAVTLSGSGSDPEEKPLSYSWRQTAGNPTMSLTSETTKTASFIAPKVAENTSLTFTLTVSDGSLSATDTITITITPDKNAFTADAGDNQTVNEGDAVTLSGSGTHPEEKPLTYSWRQTSGTDVSLSSTSVAAPTFTALNLLATEDLTFELTVSDGSLSATDTITITITADNDAPTADAGDNQTVDEGDAVTLSGSGTDPEEKPLTYSWRQTSSGTTVSLSSTSVAAPTFTAPNLLTTEDLTFELTVSDGSLSATDTVTITITADNDAPTAKAGTNQQVTQETAVTLSGSGSDPEEKPLSYSWRQTAGSPNVSLTGATTKTASFIAPKENTTLTFELTVSDGSLTGTDTVTITITPDKNAPTADAGDDQTVNEGDAVTLSGSGTHPEEKPLSYSWRQTSGTDVSLSSTSVAAPTFTAPNLLETGDLTFELTVSNGRLSTTDTVTITVEADNDAPTAEAGNNQTVDEGDAVTLSGSGTDPEQQSLTYSWRQTAGSPNVTLTNATTQTASFTAPNLLTNVDLTFELTVSDGSLTGTDTVTITVEADNDAPTAEAGNNQTVDEGDAVTLNGSGTDPEGKTLTYSWRQTSGATISLSSTSAAAPTFTAPNRLANEDLIFELTVSDGSLTATDTVTITVEADNDAPTADAGDNQTVDPGATVTLSGSGTDPEGQTLAYTWRQTSSGTTVSLSSTSVAAPTFTAPHLPTTEDLIFELTVSDGSLSATDTITITVKAADTTPDAFAFTAQTGIEPGSSVTSNAITLSGIEAATSISATGGSLVVNGSDFSGTTVSNGQTVAVKVTASSAFNTATTATVTIGGVSANFEVTTRAADTTPDAFTFTAQTGIEPGSSVTSNAITLSGIEAATSISVTGGSLVVNGSDFSGATVSNGQTVAVKVTASSAFNTATTATVTIGGVSANFEVTTRAADTTPDAFAFTAQTGVAPGSSVTSNAITVSGIEAATSISVTGGSLVVNGSDFSGTTVSNGQTVAVKVTASSSFSTATTATVTIGGVSANFEATTRAADTTPDAFAFTAQTGVAPGSSVTSNAITISGINAAASITVNGGSLVVDGSDFSGATVSNGQTVAVKVTASSAFNTATTATVTIGGVSANFEVTTKEVEIGPPTATASAGYTRIRVDWPPVASVTGYDVQVQGKPFDGGTWPTAWTSVATDIAGRKVGAQRRYMHTGLSPDSLYRYQVRSRMGAAVSAWSALIPDAAGIYPRVGTPTGFRAEAGAGQVTLLWTGPHHKSITKWRYRDATALGADTKGGWQDIEVGVNASREYSATVTDLTPGQTYRFQVRAVNGAGGGQPSAVSDAVVVAAASKPTTQPIHRLAVQALPNPFNPSTTLRLALPTPETVSLSIYNLSGQRVRVLLNAESLPAGSHTVAWDSRDDHGAQVASGLYLYRLQTKTEVVLGKMALIR